MQNYILFNIKAQTKPCSLRALCPHLCVGTAGIVWGTLSLYTCLEVAEEIQQNADSLKHNYT